MKLYIVRHAIAQERSASGRDDDRALTSEGRAKMARATQGLRKMKVALDLILTSPLRRARETAEILAEGLIVTRIEVLAELAPGHDPRSVIARLPGYSDAKAVALVGHQPALGHLVSLILTGATDSLEVDFKKGGVACIETELPAKAGSSILEWFVTPKMLRAL